MAKKKKKNRPAKSVSRRNELVVSVVPYAVPTTRDLAEPIRDGKSLAMQKTWMSEKQIMRLVERTPAQYVYKRPAKGGGQWDYVTVSYVQRVLDFVFGFNWDFEIVEHGKEQDHVWVRGRLTVRNPDGSLAVRKEQFGRSEVKTQRQSGKYLDYGNDLKAAASDALKKCASMLGIARDIYGKTDYKAESGKEPRDPAPSAQRGHDDVVPDEEDRNPEMLCNVSGCGIELTAAEYDYSRKRYGRPLCREHQKGAKAK